MKQITYLLILLCIFNDYIENRNMNKIVKKKLGKIRINKEKGYNMQIRKKQSRLYNLIKLTIISVSIGLLLSGFPLWNKSDNIGETLDNSATVKEEINTANGIQRSSTVVSMNSSDNNPVVTKTFNPEASRLVVGTDEGIDPETLAQMVSGELVRTGPMNYCTLEFKKAKTEIEKQKIRNFIVNISGVLSAEWSKTFKVDNADQDIHSDSFDLLASSTVTTAITDPEYGLQWALRKVRADKVWDEGITGEGVIVAVIDTGVDLDHPDLVDPSQNKNNLIQGYNAFTRSALPGAAQDDHGHGTSIAGLIGALNNNKGIIGVAYNTKIMPIKAMDKSGEGEDSVIADGMIWAVNHGAKIINMSIGSDSEANVLKDALQYAVDKGCLLVAASGNIAGYKDLQLNHTNNTNNNGVSYPAADPNVLAVSAVDMYDQITDFALVGPEVLLSAPGKRILTDYWSETQEGCAYSTGTSIAAPFVSGAAALLWSRYPSLTPIEIRQALLKSSYDLGVKGRDNEYGYGRLDIYRALKTLLEPQLFNSGTSLGWEGGTIYTGGTAEEPEAALEIPAGAFPMEVDNFGIDRKLMISINKTISPGDFPEEIEAASDPCVIAWGESPVEKVLTLNIRLRNSEDDDTGSLANHIAYIYRWSTDRWIRIGGGFSSGVVSASIYEPGIYMAGWSPRPQFDRILGANRILTALEIALQAFPTGADSVIVARADTYPDALAAVPLAYKYHAPIFLTNTDKLPPEVYQAIQDFKPKKIYILGETQAISYAVESELFNIADVDRIGGNNRYTTAVAISELLGVKGQAVIVNGLNFPDAIAAASHAAYQGKPILLTSPDHLIEETDAALRQNLVVDTEVIGGITAVTENVYSILPHPIRLNGANRYATSARVIESNMPDGKVLYVATGRNFPDALTGGVLASLNSSNIMLLSAEGPVKEQKEILQRMNAKTVIALGGDGALSQNVLSGIKMLVEK